MRSSLYGAHIPHRLHPFTLPLLSHQSMQHKPLCMQLARQTGWKRLQFSPLIAFCTEASMAPQLSMTSQHINTYLWSVDKHTQRDVHALRIHGEIHHTKHTHNIEHDTDMWYNCVHHKADPLVFNTHIIQTLSSINMRDAQKGPLKEMFAGSSFGAVARNSKQSLDVC